MRLLAPLLFPLLALAASPGTLILEDQFNAPALDKAWRAAKGEWMQDGAALRTHPDPQLPQRAGLERPRLVSRVETFRVRSGDRSPTTTESPWVLRSSLQSRAPTTP